jgi:hypothetical protein
MDTPFGFRFGASHFGHSTARLNNLQSGSDQGPHASMTSRALVWRALICFRYTLPQQLAKANQSQPMTYSSLADHSFIVQLRC